MKRMTVVVVLTAASLGSCSGSGDSGIGSVESPTDSPESLPGDVADTGMSDPGVDDGEGEIPEGTFQGQAASLACRAPDYAADHGPFVNLDLMAFERYQQRSEASVSLPEAAIATLQVALVSLVNSDVAFASVYCNYNLFESTACVRSSIDGFTVDPASLVGDQLSFTLAFADDPVTFEHIIDNRDYDSGSVRVTDSRSGKVDLLEWSRDADGTERFDRHVAGTREITYSWVENADCSGTADVTDSDGTTVEFSSNLLWTSPQDDDFTFDFTNCSTLEGEKQCASGTL